MAVPRRNDRSQGPDQFKHLRGPLMPEALPCELQRRLDVEVAPLPYPIFVGEVPPRNKALCFKLRQAVDDRRLRLEAPRAISHRPGHHGARRTQCATGRDEIKKTDGLEHPTLCSCKTVRVSDPRVDLNPAACCRGDSHKPRGRLQEVVVHLVEPHRGKWLPRSEDATRKPCRER